MESRDQATGRKLRIFVFFLLALFIGMLVDGRVIFTKRAPRTAAATK